MNNDIFPQKKVYIYLSKIPVTAKKVYALNDNILSVSQKFKNYADNKWESENKNWISSAIPTAMKVDCNSDSMVIHCGMSEYKYIFGGIKLAKEKNKIPSELINGLATEIIPVTSDECFFLERRDSKITQHGIGFYDIPTAGQNAQMYIDEAKKKQPGLVNDIFDTAGFPKWNLIRHLNLKQEEIGEIFYTGFSKGFEVSLASLFNGYARINLKAEEIMSRLKAKEILCYRLDDLPKLLNSIGNDGNNKKIKADIYGNAPGINPQTHGFALVEDSFGGILGVLKQFRGEEAYLEALKIMKEKGYEIILLKQEKINLAELD